MEIPGLIALAGAVGLVALVWHNRKMGAQIDETRRSLESEKRSADQAKASEKQLGEARTSLVLETHRADQAEANEKQLTQNNNELVRLVNERSNAMPWLTTLAADLHWVQDERAAKHLESKRHPARNAAESVRAHAQEKRDLRIENSLFRYRIALMEHLVPWLKDVAFEDAETVAEQELLDTYDSTDPAAGWLSKDEWERLPPADRYQQALDRYRIRRKSDWEVGRDFERFIGFQLESQGYKVVYHGAIKGFDDFGRDLIATDWTGKVLLVQCKRWSTHRSIPEAVLFQLFGSAVSYYVEKTGSTPTDLNFIFSHIEPWLYSTASVHQRIREIALVMGVRIKDDVVVEDWPMIKCNIATNGDRIYHLPMDQQYDRVMIAKEGECYVRTVVEAESLNFRRAKRWLAVTTD
jgi:Restriction endonuclease